MPALLVVSPPGPETDALAGTLEGKGFQVLRASTGSAAVQVAVRHLPDAILMDPMLSAMDRWHAVKRLTTERDTAGIPVLTLVSDTVTPVGLQRLLTRIERTVGFPSTPEPARAVAARPVPRPAPVRPPEPLSEVVATPDRPQERSTGRILVVDDNDMNRDLLARRLQRVGFEVRTAASGEAALEAVAVDSFDLVLLDWMMPGMSGIEVLEQIRRSHSAIELPVVMATARTEVDDVVAALRAEANDYVTKPLNFELVHARIRTQLRLVAVHRDRLSAERRYRALLENTGDLIVQLRPDGEVLYVSPASRALLGFEPEALRERSFYDWFHPVDRRELEERHHQPLPAAYTYLARMRRQDLEWIWVETSCRVLQEAGGVVIQAACRDVSEHMDRVGGDEPPLPLGGDLAAHPGWRGSSGGSGKHAAVQRPPEPTLGEEPTSNGAGVGQPVVLTIVVGDLGGLSVEGLSDRVTTELRKALGASHG